MPIVDQNVCDEVIRKAKQSTPHRGPNGDLHITEMPCELCAIEQVRKGEIERAEARKNGEYDGHNARTMAVCEKHGEIYPPDGVCNQCWDEHEGDRVVRSSPRFTASDASLLVATLMRLGFKEPYRSADTLLAQEEAMG